MSQPFIVSIHIPKTAGTSLALIFDRCFKRRVMYDYQDYSEPQIASPDVVDHARFIEANFDVLHGHFFATKYLEVFPNAAFIATLRHPVSRVISQFHHELNDPGSRSWYHNDIVSGRMDVVDFSKQDGVADAMSRHLAGLEPQDYALLLVSENLPASCALLRHVVRPLDIEEHFGVPPKLPFLNRADERPVALDMGQDVRRAIFEQTHRDNELYATAVRLLEHRLAFLS